MSREDSTRTGRRVRGLGGERGISKGDFLSEGKKTSEIECNSI